MNTMKNIFIILLLLSLMGSCAGLGGNYHWILDLFSHFNLQYMAMGAIGFLIFLFMKPKKYLLLSLLIIGINLFTILPYITFAKDSKKPTNRQLKILSYNVYSQSESYLQVFNEIKVKNPDIIFLMEVTPEWTKKLKPLKKIYPYVILKPQFDNFGVAMYSKHKYIKARYKKFSEVPSICVKIRIKKKILNIIATHPYPPIGQDGTNLRNKHLAKIANFIQRLKQPTILMGDLNITPFSPIYKNFLEKTKLQNFGILPTWNKNIPIFAIALDHILISKEITFLEKEIGESFGSDHNMIFTTVGF